MKERQCSCVMHSQFLTSCDLAERRRTGHLYSVLSLQLELELSAQDQAAEPPASLFSLTIARIDPYDPPAMQKKPIQMTNIDQATPKNHLCRAAGVVLPWLWDQLSWSHMKPYACIVMNVPRNAPIRDTKALKTGMALAMMYATRTTPLVQLSQVVQCVHVLEVRCFVPRRKRTKKFFAGTWGA